jgi:hypothetical protein
MFVTPPDIPEDRHCRTIKIPNSHLWLGIFNKAILATIYTWNWIQIYDDHLTAAEAAAEAYLIYENYLSNNSCAGVDLAPYWDDPEGDDANGETEPPGIPWYETIADFIVTAFLAVSFEPGAAIQFVTTARKFRLAFRSRDYGAVVKIFLNDVLQTNVDTYGAAPGMVYADILVPDVMPSSVTLRIEHSGDHNPAAIPTEDGYAIEVIRKRLDAAEMGIQDVRLTGGQIEVQRTLGGAWTAISGGEVVRRDGALDPDVTGTFTIQPIGAAIPMIIKRATSGFNANLLMFQDAAAASILGVDSAGAMRWYTSNGSFRWDSGAFSFNLATTRILRMQSNGVRSSVPYILDALPTEGIQGQMTGGWENATFATRRGYVSHIAGDASGGQEYLRGSSSGTAPKVGFLGASPVIKPAITGDDGGNLALRELLTKLATYGLITNSTTHGTVPGGMMLRQNPDNACQLQQSSDEGETWSLAFDYSLCGITGDPPVTWDIDIPVTITVEAPEDTFTRSDGEDTADAAIRTQAFCAAVTATVDAMLDAYADAVDESYTALEVAAAAFALAAAIGAIVLTGGAASPIVLGWAIASAALLAAVAFGSSVTSAMVNDPDIHAAMACMMYLTLKDKPISPVTFKTAFAEESCLGGDEEAVRAMMNGMLNSAYGDQLYMGFVSVLGSATFAAKTGAELPTCMVCEDRTWCYGWEGEEQTTADFTVECGAWSTSLVIDPCSGLGGNYGAVVHQNVSFYVPPGTTVTAVEFYYRRWNTASTHTIQIVDNDGGAASVVNPPFVEGWFGLNESTGYSKTDVILKIDAGIYSNGTHVNAAIDRIRVRGTGVPLFGICDRCE